MTADFAVIISKHSHSSHNADSYTWESFVRFKDGKCVCPPFCAPLLTRFVSWKQSAGYIEACNGKICNPISTPPPLPVHRSELYNHRLLAFHKHSHWGAVSLVMLLLRLLTWDWLSPRVKGSLNGCAFCQFTSLGCQPIWMSCPTDTLSHWKGRVWEAAKHSPLERAFLFSAFKVDWLKQLGKSCVLVLRTKGLSQKVQ